MTAIDWIIEGLFSAASFFYRIYEEVNSWWSPFNWLANPFNWLWSVFDGLARAFIRFKAWVEVVSERLKDIRSWEDIKNLVLSIFPWLKGILNWFEDKLPWVTTIITNWWLAVKLTITTPLNLLRGDFDSLKVDWLNWLTIVSPTFATIAMVTDMGKTWQTESSDLTDSKFREELPFLSALREIWDNVIKFFTNPLDFLVSKLEDWFWEGDEE